MPPHADQPRTLADRVALIGLVLGPVLAAVAYVLLPHAGVDEATGVVTGLSQPGRATAAVGVLMAVWWLTEAIPISATALLPLVLLPLTGAMGIKDAASPYANDVIYLFMGGFMLGLAMEKWGLHKRIALTTLLIVGTDCPVLTVDHLQQAADVLQTQDAVLIPAEDGGYVLIGLRRALPEVFDGVEWSTPQVLAQTQARLRAAGASWQELPTLWDVDEPADWARWQEMQALRQR